MNNNKTNTNNQLADELSKLAAVEPTAETVTNAAPETAAESMDALFAPQTPDGSVMAEVMKKEGGLTVRQLFSKVIFRAVDKQVFKSDDGGRFSRKVADLAIELAGSGLFMPGSISEVQAVKDKEAHLELAFLYSHGSRRSAISTNDQGKPTADLREWKDETIEAWKVYADKMGIVPGDPVKTEHKHVIVGRSIIS